MPSGARNYCFTINNYNDTDESKLRKLLPDRAVYVVYGKERGESGTPHLQGYIQLSGKHTLRWCKSNIHATAHFEVARGTPEEASNYCKKDGDFVELGERRGGQGTRSDLRAVVNLLKEGASNKRIAEEHPNAIIRYGNGIGRLRMVLAPPTREAPPEIQVYWGATGLGKTRKVHSLVDREELWIHPGDRWFDGYDAHAAVLFDDFDGGWFKLGYLLKLLDRYTFQVPIKGGYAWWGPKKIFITSNIDPRLWYQSASEAQNAALQRRLREFGEIHHFENPFNL